MGVVVVFVYDSAVCDAVCECVGEKVIVWFFVKERDIFEVAFQLGGVDSGENVQRVDFLYKSSD